MPYHCVAKVQRALNDAGRPVKGSRIALLGVSYKPGARLVVDLRSITRGTRVENVVRL